MYRLMIIEEESCTAKGLENIQDWEDVNIHIVGTAANGREALDVIDELQPDILLIDFRMPNMAGMELLNKLAESLDAMPHVIIITGYDNLNYVSKGVDCILKPIDLIDLKQKIKTVVQKLDKQRQDKTRFQTVLVENTIYQSLLMEKNRKLDIKIPFHFFAILFSVKSIPSEILFPIQNNSIFYLSHYIYVLWFYNTEQADSFLKRESLNRLGEFPIGKSSKYNTTEFRVYDAYKEAEENFLMNYSEFNLNDETDLHSVTLTNEREKQWLQILQCGDKNQLCNMIRQCLKSYPIFEQKWYLVVQFYLFLMKYVQLPAKNSIAFIFKLRKIRSERELDFVFETMISTFLCSTSLQRKEKVSSFTKKAVNLIKQKYHNSYLSLREVAGELGISPAYLSVIFKNEMGINFIHFLTQKRIERAKKELLESKKTINEISSISGFNDVKYFLKVFKKEIGLTPNQFREFHQVSKTKVI